MEQNFNISITVFAALYDIFDIVQTDPLKYRYCLGRTIAQDCISQPLTIKHNRSSTKQGSHAFFDVKYETSLSCFHPSLFDRVVIVPQPQLVDVLARTCRTNFLIMLLSAYKQPWSRN